jgi:hypothetical protein
MAMFKLTYGLAAPEDISTEDRAWSAGWFFSATAFNSWDNFNVVVSPLQAQIHQGGLP